MFLKIIFLYCSFILCSKTLKSHFEILDKVRFYKQISIWPHSECAGHVQYCLLKKERKYLYLLSICDKQKQLLRVNENAFWKPFETGPFRRTIANLYLNLTQN